MKCMVKCCPNSRKYTRGKSFFRFPKDDQLRELWLQAIGRDDARVTENSNVCEDHFSQNLLITKRTRKNIDYGAVPKHLAIDCAKCSMSQRPTETFARVVETVEETSEKVHIQNTVLAGVENVTQEEGKYSCSSLTLGFESRDVMNEEGANQFAYPAIQECVEEISHVAIFDFPVLVNIPADDLNVVSEQLIFDDNVINMPPHADDMVTQGCRKITTANLSEANISEVPVIEEYSGSLTIANCMETSDEEESNYSSSKEKRRHEKLKKLSKLLVKKNKTIKRLRDNVQYKKRKIAKLLDDLKSRNLIGEEAREQLSQIAGQNWKIFEQEFLKNRIKSRPKAYSSKVRAFALNLNFLSPNAYNYVSQHVIF